MTSRPRIREKSREGVDRSSRPAAGGLAAPALLLPGAPLPPRPSRRQLCRPVARRLHRRHARRTAATPVVGRRRHRHRRPAGTEETRSPPTTTASGPSRSPSRRLHGHRRRGLPARRHRGPAARARSPSTSVLGASADGASPPRSEDYDERRRPASRTVPPARARSTGCGSACSWRWPRLGLSLIYGTTGLSNFAHAEQVTLGGVVAYGLVNVGGLNLWLGSVVTDHLRRHRLRPGPRPVATAATTGLWAHPDDDRDDRLVARLAVRLPVLHRHGTVNRRDRRASTPTQDRPDHRHQPVVHRDGHLDRRCSPPSATSCSAPGSAAPPGRCPTTRRSPRRPASTSTG